MKYDIFIKDHVRASKENVEMFAKRAGVHRSSVYRAINGMPLMFPLVKRMVEAAGGKIEIVPQATPTPKRGEGDDDAE